MRRTGKTTRLIDKCIQSLFKYGCVYFPSNNELKNESYLRLTDKYRGFEIFADSDWINGNCVRRDLIRRVLRRLETEHPHLKINHTVNKIEINEV